MATVGVKVMPKRMPCSAGFHPEVAPTNQIHICWRTFLRRSRTPLQSILAGPFQPPLASATRFGAVKGKFDQTCRIWSRNPKASNPKASSVISRNLSGFLEIHHRTATRSSLHRARLSVIALCPASAVFLSGQGSHCWHQRSNRVLSKSEL